MSDNSFFLEEKSAREARSYDPVKERGRPSGVQRRRSFIYEDPRPSLASIARSVTMSKGQAQSTYTSIIGVVADIRREFENDFVANKCCLYGLNRDEFHALALEGEIHPTFFTEEADRYVYRKSPWRAMRILGRFGYFFSVTPLGGRVDSTVGERRTCIWTMVKSNGPLPVNNE